MKKNDTILLAHGSGGKLSHRIIEDVFLPKFANPLLQQLDDGAVFTIGNQRVAFSTDSYVVDPIFFPGGDIGKIAVCGTINDLAMMGSHPLYVSAAFILEEGYSITDLEKILNSMKEIADEAGVQIVTGDTKVVAKGNADKLFVNTTGLGIIEHDLFISGSNAQVGDKIIINGSIGEHGVAVMSKREGIQFEVDIQSDAAPLNGLVADILEVTDGIHVMRDPTRGGLATTLNEIAMRSNRCIVIDEAAMPINGAVMSACEMLGFDPLYVANEGKVVVIVKAESADAVLQTMRKHRYGRNAQLIGEVLAQPTGKVILKTRIGGKRIVDMLTGDQLPRIC